MAYVYRQKLNIYDLVSKQPDTFAVIVAELAPELGKMYCSYLSEQELTAHHCQSLDSLHSMLKDLEPEVLVCSTDFFPSHEYMATHLDFARKSFPSLKIITVGEDLGVSELKRLMNFGLSGHLEKKLTRPVDVALIVRGLLGF